jgi:hypothetical protein
MAMVIFQPAKAAFQGPLQLVGGAAERFVE